MVLGSRRRRDPPADWGSSNASVPSVLSIILMIVCSASCSSLEVLQFSPEDDAGGWHSQALLLSPGDAFSSPSRQMSLCYRIKIYRYLPHIYWVNVLEYFRKEDKINNEIRIMWTAQGPYAVVRNNFVALSDMEVKLMHWYNHCFSYDYQTGWFKMFLDGKLIQEGKVDKWLGELRPNGSLALGTASTLLCGEGDPDSSCESVFSGEFGDFNVWSRVLDDREMEEITQCKRHGNGDILDWTTARWSKRKVNTVTYPSLSSICAERSDGFAVFPELRHYDEIFRFCRSLGGEMATPETPQENQRLLETIKPFKTAPSGKCPRFFLGWTDEHSEGTFVSENVFRANGTLSPLPEEMERFWRVGEPNGGRLESCSELSDHDMWNDMPCTEVTKSCTACYFRERPMFTLRGLCNAAPFDTKYIMTKQYSEDKVVIKGYFHTMVRWEREEEEGGNSSSSSSSSDKGGWRLRTVQSNETFAQLLSKSENAYPAGRRKWLVHSDVCASGDATVRNLTLTSCVKGQFTCDSGDCVSLDKRCDNVGDCPDGTDEVDCRIVSLPEGYRQAAPPPPPIANAEDGKRLEVLVDVTVLDFSEINVTKMKMRVDFILSLTWFDRRLEFRNLSPSFSLNTLSSLVDLRRLWVPEVNFRNTEGNKMSRLDESSEGYVLLNGSFEYNTIRENREAKIYQGSENPIVLHRKYTIEFICNFQLKKYPFDLQRCPMIFQLKKPTHEEAVLRMNSVHYLGGTELLEYRIKDIASDDHYLCGRQDMLSCNQVVITLKRRVGNQLLNTYLPTGCLLIIIYLTHYFKIEHYDTRIMVGLTGMLVIASLFVSTSASLPKTSYMKMIDVWMIFCFLLPFVVVILHTVVEYQGDLVTYGWKSAPPSPVPPPPPASPNHYVTQQQRHQNGGRLVANNVGSEFDPQKSPSRSNNSKMMHLEHMPGRILRRPHLNSGSINNRGGRTVPPPVVLSAPLARGTSTNGLRGRRRQLMVDYFARLAVPLVIVVFNLVYWGVALGGEDGGIEV